MKVSELFEKLIDNGPGLIKAPKINYDRTRNETGGFVSKSELQARKEAVRKDKQHKKELEKAGKAAQAAADALKNAKKKIDPAVVGRKIEEVVGNVWPDGDPIDWLAPWVVKTYGVKDWDVITVLDKGAKAINKRYKGYYDYLAQTWDDFAEDNMEMLKQSGQTSNPWK